MKLIPLKQYLVIILFTICFFDSGHCIQLSGFKQTPLEMELQFDTPPAEVRYKALMNVPAKLDLTELSQGTVKIDPIANHVVIPINAMDELARGEYAIFLFVNDEWIEFVRHSSRWLAENFNYSKSEGSTILGRHSIQVANKSNPVLKMPAIKFVGRPHFPNIQVASESVYGEVNTAVGLLNYLWSMPILQGPTSRSYSDFLKLRFEEKLKQLNMGEFAVSCSGFRDLFLHAAYGVSGFKVRAVNAFNYYPPFRDLITYSHSLAEIWIERLGKWVIFDPWFGIMVTNNRGEFVGVLELQQSKNYPQNFVIVPVIPKITRMYKHEDGHFNYVDFYPGEMQVSDFSCGELACSPGYMEYFNHVHIHEATNARRKVIYSKA